MVGDQQAVALNDPFLRDLLDQLDAVMLDYHALTDSLSEEQLNWQPDAKRWSIAQCLQHMTLTVLMYPHEIERMIGDARVRYSSGGRRLRQGLVAKWIVNGMEPPPRMRIRTARKAEPVQVQRREEVLGGFEAAHSRLRELILACDGVPLDHARMRSPFMPLFRFTLRQALQVNLAHARRHLWQARQVSQDPRFPG